MEWTWSQTGAPRSKLWGIHLKIIVQIVKILREIIERSKGKGENFDNPIDPMGVQDIVQRDKSKTVFTPFNPSQNGRRISISLMKDK